MSKLFRPDRLLALAEQLNTSVVSFDVFDTVVTRVFARPKDLFIALGEELSARGITTLHPNRFARLRIQAETDARLDRSDHEPGLSEIIARLSKRLGWCDATAEAVTKAELDLEERALVPLLPMVAGAAAVRASGRRVVFISDMYLPAEFIRQILLKHSIAEPADPVFVSNLHRTSKHSGGLFKVALQQLQVAPQNVLHVGDNLHSDSLIPRKLGMHTVHFTASHLGMIEETHLPYSAELRGMPSLIAGAARIGRLHRASGSSDPALTEIGAGLLGPILVAFTLWAFARARQEGIKRLYFVSRDGQVMREIAMALQKRLPRLAGIECRYLYGSRIAWHHASLTTLSPRHLRWLLDPQPIINANILAHRLGLPCKCLLDCLRGTRAELLLPKPSWTSSDLSILREVLPVHQDKLLSAADAASRVQIAQRYFEQEGLFDSTSWGVVELGWSGSMLTSLSHVLQAPQRINAYYLCQTREDSELPVAVQLESFLMQPGGIQSVLGRGLRLAEMIEALTAADHPTVLGFREEAGRVVPILKENTVPMWTPEALASLREGAYGFVQALETDTIQKLEGLVADETGARLMAVELLSVLARFVAEPPSHLATPFTQCSFSEDPADEHRRSFARSITIREALSRTPFGEDELWRRGSLACSSGLVQALVAGGVSCALGHMRRRVLKF